MDTQILEKQVTYYRYDKDDSDLVTKELRFEALFVKASASSFTPFKNKFPVRAYLPCGIDKLGFSLPLDYVNEHSPVIGRIKNGPVTLVQYGAYLSILVHREFLLHDENILEQVRAAVWELLNRGIFKIPIWKKTYRVVEKKEEYDTYNHKVKNLDYFFAVIWSQLSLSLIEIYFDYLYNIRKYFEDRNFHIENKTTLYSLDYAVRENGNKQISYVCIYDKQVQLEEVKKVSVDEPWHRVEFRHQNRYSIMASKDVLDGTFEDIFVRLEDTMVRKLRKLNRQYLIDWSRFHAVLQVDDKLKHLLDRAFYGKKEKYQKQTPQDKHYQISESEKPEENESANDLEVPQNEDVSNKNSISMLEKLNCFINAISSIDFTLLSAIKTAIRHMDDQNSCLNSYIIRGP